MTIKTDSRPFSNAINRARRPSSGRVICDVRHLLGSWQLTVFLPKIRNLTLYALLKH